MVTRSSFLAYGSIPDWACHALWRNWCPDSDQKLRPSFIPMHTMALRTWSNSTRRTFGACRNFNMERYSMQAERSFRHSIICTSIFLGTFIVLKMLHSFNIILLRRGLGVQWQSWVCCINVYWISPIAISMTYGHLLSPAMLLRVTIGNLHVKNQCTHIQHCTAVASLAWYMCITAWIKRL